MWEVRYVSCAGCDDDDDDDDDDDNNKRTLYTLIRIDEVKSCLSWL